MENVVLSDATGFSPEGVRTALLSLAASNKTDCRRLASLQHVWSRILTSRIDRVMMKYPRSVAHLRSLVLTAWIEHESQTSLPAWVNGESVESIAKKYFSGDEASPIH